MTEQQRPTAGGPPAGSPGEMMAALWAALSRAQGRVERVSPDRRHGQIGFNYTSSEAVIAAGSRALSAEGLALVPIRTGEVIETGAAESRSGPLARVMVWIRQTYWLVHADGGWVQLVADVPVRASGKQDADKSVYGALTQSLGYTLRDLLLIPRTDETQTPSGRGTGPRQRQRQQQEEPAAWSDPRALRVRDYLARHGISPSDQLATVGGSSGTPLSEEQIDRLRELGRVIHYLVREGVAPARQLATVGWESGALSEEQISALATAADQVRSGQVTADEAFAHD